MSRYIDAEQYPSREWMIDFLYDCGVRADITVEEIADGLLYILSNVPTADVVEVVRCKECKYLIEHHYEEDGEEPYVKYTCRWSGNYQRYLSDFCSYGERREDG